MPILHLTPIVKIPSLTPVFTPQEKAQLRKLGASQTLEGKWLLLDGREVLSKPIMRAILTQLHQGSHGGVPRLCVVSSSDFMCVQESVL
jgi:hypothetical protein